MENKTRVALYERVSTGEQKNSIQDQIEQLEALAIAYEWEIAGHYTDEGISGGTDSRPELQRLMIDAHAGEFDLVVVTKLDRFMRNTRLLLDYVDTLEKKCNVCFFAKSEGIDTRESGIGKVILALLGAIAEWERERIGERQKDSRQYHASKGLWTGGSVPYGYRRNPETKTLKAYEPEAEVIRYMYYYYLNLSGNGIDGVVTHLIEQDMLPPRHGKWNKSTVDDKLKHPAYKGGPNTDWKYICDTIVDEKLWNAVQNKRANNFRRIKPSRGEHEFNSLLFCGLCGHTVAVSYSNGKPTYTCNGRLKRFHLDGSPRCTLPIIKDAMAFDIKLNALIMADFSSRERMNYHFQNTIDNLENEFNLLMRELYPLNSQIERLE
ncbi:MAG: recombinase family protein [Dehalococcoidales bacterium]|nr:MAG: recombinase family protein [Dehalococcoidales bacterium]